MYVDCDRQKRKLEEMYDALRKEYELLRRSIASSTPDNTAVVQRPNPYSFAPNFNGLDDIRHQSSGLSGNFVLIYYYTCVFSNVRTE